MWPACTDREINIWVGSEVTQCQSLSDMSIKGKVEGILNGNGRGLHTAFDKEGNGDTL